MVRSVLNTELVSEFLLLCSTQLNIYVLDGVGCLQGGVCLPLGGRLESMAEGFSKKKNKKGAGRSAAHHEEMAQILRCHQAASLLTHSTAMS